MKSQRFTETMVLVVAILGSGIVFLDQTAVNVALPAIQKSLGASITDVQWILDIYLLTLSVLMLIGGVLGDMYGRVRVYVIGMGIFLVASILCGIAPNSFLLIVGRFLQGVGGATMVPGGLAIINAVVHEDRRGRMLGIWGTFSPLITIAGPVVGGWLVDAISWRAVFFLNIPLGLAAMYIALRYVPENRNEEASKTLDWIGVTTLMIGLGGILIGLIEGPNIGWSNPLIWISFVAGVAGMIAFVVSQQRVPNPLIPLSVFKIRNFTGANLLTVVLFIGLGGPFFFLTLNFQQVQGYSASQAGLATMPIALAIFLLSRRMGAWSDKVGTRPILIVATILIGFGFLGLSRPGIETNYWTDWLPALIVYALGIACMVVPLTTMGLAALPQKQSGIASGVNNAASRLGQMLSIAVIGALFAAQFGTSLSARANALPLDEGQRDALMLQSRSLGAAQPPAGLSESTTQAVEEAIKLAFVDGFRLMMYLSSALVFMSLLILLFYIRPETKRPGEQGGGEGHHVVALE